MKEALHWVCSNRYFSLIGILCFRFLKKIRTSKIKLLIVDVFEVIRLVSFTDIVILLHKSHPVIVIIKFMSFDLYLKWKVHFLLRF